VATRRLAFGDRSTEKRKMVRQIGGRRPFRRSRDRAIIEIAFRSLDEARAFVRRARSERLHQDRVGTVGPKPIVEQDPITPKAIAHPPKAPAAAHPICRGAKTTP
jgi:hypothetical protein